MLQISYKPAFLRKLQKLSPNLQQKIKECIALFRDNSKNPMLRVHKLQGGLKGRWSFSVDYQYRIVFRFEEKHSVVLLAVGDHDVYK